MTAATATPLPTTHIRVDAVRIGNFRSLRNIEMDLGTITLLVGMNNTGKTSFLKALHLALGADRRLISSDDFFIGPDGNEAAKILIDVRIVPVDADGNRCQHFDQSWIDNDFGGSNLISLDSEDRDFLAFRTQITHDVVKNDFTLERQILPDWPPFATWQEVATRGRAPRFEQLASFFIDAQRDVIGDLRARGSYMGKLLSKIEIPDAAIAELEERLRTLNDDIVSQSEVLNHIRTFLAGLNRTLPSFGEGVEINPVSTKMRDVVKGVGVQFSDGAGSSFPLESHGMGTRSWASLLTFDAYVSWTGKLAEREGLPFHPVLFLEEPEAHLHPNAQRSVYGQLSLGVGQRIVSTHSPYIAGQANLGEIVYFSKDGVESKLRRLPSAALDAEEIRKIRREVMRTRGELLFASAIVLFEGETEEQALPIFASHHWNHHPFERGVAFVGVGGEGNYFPFIRIFEAIGVPWFILSDGEQNACNSVRAALVKAGLTTAHPNVFTIPNGKAIEGYLIDEGYQAELKNAVTEFHKPFHNAQHEQAKRTEIMGWSDSDLEAYLKSNKTGMAPHWAKAIIARNDARSIPTAIKNLLAKMDQLLIPTPPVPNP
ncbi:MAG: AAA family ATPase [Akkermansiaceae bacterium]|nr:AAA family ATPase [Akkermansiaceae bacterium]